ncbi:MAG: DUF1700 domain-containing protein [Stomatobaculum sp.]|nr:DUF1700 domain-containing protein [Stomatobaculum sp.]
MTKQEFLEGLRERLLEEGADVLVPENLNYYDSYIEEEKQKGRTEEDVLEELGNPALIARSILEAAGYEVDGIPDAAPGQYNNARTTEEEQFGEQFSQRMEQTEESFRPVTDKVMPWLILTGVLLIVIIVVLGFFAIMSKLLIPILIVMVVLRLFRMFGGTGY